MSRTGQGFHPYATRLHSAGVLTLINVQSNKNNSCIAFLKIKITEDVEDYCITPPFFIIILLELSFVQIVGLGSLFLSATNSEELNPGRDCDTGSESRLEQHPPLDTPTDPQFPLVRKTGTWVAADSGASPSTSPATPSVQARLPLQPATATSLLLRSSSDSAPSLPMS